MEDTSRSQNNRRKQTFNRGTRPHREAGPTIHASKSNGSVMSIHGVENAGGSKQTGEPEDQDMYPCQQYFSKLFPKLFTRTGKIRNSNVQAEFFKNIVTVQQKGRRVPVTLQDKVDKEIDKLFI